MTRRLSRPLALILALAMSTPFTARADEASVIAAESLFKEGRALFDKGQVEEACDRFTRSQQLDPAVGTLLNLGECYERLDKLASAWSAYRQATALAVTRNDERRATIARKAALRLEPDLARLTITSAESPVGLVVTRNGIRIDAAALETAVPVDPGKQEIEVTAPERKPWRTTVEVRAREASTVRIPRLAPAAPRPPTNEPLSVSDGSRGDTQRTVGVGIGVGGGVVLATGLVFGTLALLRWGSVDDTCPGGRCPSEADRQRQASDVDTARTFATLSTVTTIAGAAGVAAGIALHLTAPKHGVGLAPLVDRQTVGLAITLAR